MVRGWDPRTAPSIEIEAVLSTLNAVLARGAAEFGFTSVRPDFTGHQLCTPQPYVQGLGDAAPFHPTSPGPSGGAFGPDFMGF